MPSTEEMVSLDDPIMSSPIRLYERGLQGHPVAEEEQLERQCPSGTNLPAHFVLLKVELDYIHVL